MSYDVCYLDTEFVIDRSNFVECIAEIEEYHRVLVPEIKCPGGALAHPEKDIEKKISYALAHFGWSVVLDDAGISGIDRAHNCKGDSGVLMAIARFVEPGSSIELIGEDGRAFKYVFKDNTLIEFLGEIVYRAVT